MGTRILLADDHRIVREGIRALLLEETNMLVVGEAETGREAVELARKLKPDVVVMDIAMPDLNGMDATRQIMDACPSTRVIALSMHSDKRFVREMLLAGAAGYLRKGCQFDELVEAIQTVVVGETYLAPEIASAVAADYVDYVSRGAPSALSSLTPREREVLQLLAEGKRTKQIGGMLHVSVKTVSTHRRHIMKKLGVDSLAGLIKYAVREGITSVEP